MKLYSYFEDYGQMGSIEGMFISTPEELKKYSGLNLYWDDLLGKYSEGQFTFDETTLTEIDVPEYVVQILYNQIGKVISGPFDFEYFDEILGEQELEEELE